MNLGEHLLLLAKPLANASSLSSVQLSENAIDEENIIELCSALGVNRDFTKKNWNYRLKLRNQSSIYKEISQMVEKKMNNKVRIVNNHYLKNVQQKKKQMKIDEF